MPSNTATIHYQIAINDITGHYFDVSLHIQRPAPDGQTLSLPAWIPGSYMIRDFAKNIVSLSAVNAAGQAVKVAKLDKQTWQLAPSDQAVTVQYRVFAFDLSIRSAYINDQFAFFNGTSLCLQVHGQEEDKHSVEFTTPTLSETQQWQVATTLTPSANTRLHNFGLYHADNYAELIDHPVLIGDYDIVAFNTGDIDFELILAGGNQADTQRIADDLTKICQHHIDLFGSKPDINRYLFITLLNSDGYGGLEHMASTALLFSRDDLPTLADADKMTEGYRNFLALCSHEFLHTWHVKRIKPQALAQANLQAETYTEQLWIYEGFTSYYDDYALRRAGVISETEYLEVVGQNLTRLLRNQGRFKQSVTESSFDAWTKFYKQGADAINNIVSYYNKGAVIAMCLDLAIRQQSAYSLDDVMSYLWQAHGLTGIGTQDDVIHHILSEQLGLNLTELLDLCLYSCEELPVEQLLQGVGVKLHTRAQGDRKDLGGKPLQDAAKVDFGARYTAASIGIQIQAISETSSAYAAGLQVGDKVIAINHWQTESGKFQRQLASFADQDSVSLSVLRDKRLLTLAMPIQAAALNSIYLTIEDQAAANAWLHSNL